MPRTDSNDIYPDVDRRQDVLPLRPQRSDDPVQLRSAIEEGHRADQEHRQGHHVGQRRAGRHRLRAVRAGTHLRHRERQGARRQDRDRRRPHRSAPALPERVARTAQRRDLAHRRARRLRSPRRGADRARRQGRGAQPDQHTGCHGAHSGVVAGRQVHRLLLRRIRRIRAAHQAAERGGGDEEDSAGRQIGLLLRPQVVAGQQGHRVQRQHGQPVDGGDRDAARPPRWIPTTSTISTAVSTGPAIPSGSRSSNSCPTACAPSGSTRWRPARACRSPTA